MSVSHAKVAPTFRLKVLSNSKLVSQETSPTPSTQWTMSTIPKFESKKLFPNTDPKMAALQSKFGVKTSKITTALFWYLSVPSPFLQMLKIPLIWSVSVQSQMSSKRQCQSQFLKMADSLRPTLFIIGTTTGLKSQRLNQLEDQKPEVPRLQSKVETFTLSEIFFRRLIIRQTCSVASQT